MKNYNGFYDTMPNEYLQKFRDKFDVVLSKVELDNLKCACCEGCRYRQTCNEEFCKLYHDYKLFREIIEDVRRPRVIYVEGKDPNKIKWPTKKRRYKISAKAQCKRTALAQVTRLLKECNEKQAEELVFIREHLEGERFKRALAAAEKHNYNNIAKTIGVYIGALAAKRENKQKGGD